MPKIDALSSMQGYLYQKLVTVYLACRFLSEHKVADKDLENWYLVLEKYDDVSLCKGTYNSDIGKFTEKNEIHLIQCKRYKEDTFTRHGKGILQLYLNSILRRNEGRTDVYVNFVTGEHITYSSKNCYLIDNVDTDKVSLLRKLNEKKSSFTNLPKSTDPINQSTGKFSAKDFPREFVDIDFPETFDENSYHLTNILDRETEKCFSVLSYKSIDKYISDILPKLNNDYRSGDNLLQKLYYTLTSKIFEKRGIISMKEIEDILDGGLSENLDDLIAHASYERKCKLKKDILLGSLTSVFDASDIIYILFTSNEKTPNDKEELFKKMENAYDQLYDYIDGITDGSELNSLIYGIALKEDEPINSLSDLLKFSQHCLPIPTLSTWLRTYLLFMVKCSDKSFEDLILVTGLGKNNLLSIRNSLYGFYEKGKIIGSYETIIANGANVLKLDGDIKETMQINELDGDKVTKTYEVRVCCVQHVNDIDWSNKFWDSDACEYCKTIYK